MKPLAEKRAVGQKEADDAVSNAELARAAVKAAEARAAEVNLSLGYTRVTAPITGLSSRANKSEGSLVTANDTLLTLIWQVDPIWVPFNVSENDRLGLERAVAAGKLTLPKDNAYDVTIKLTDGSTFPRKGKINFSDTRVNPTTGTYEMRAEIANADGALKPGQFVRVALKGAVRNNAIAVPQVAVQDGAQGKFVYVTGKDKDGKDIAVVRPVTLGDWVEVDGVNLWVVESGLAAGDTVIVDGIAKLQPGGAIALGGPGGGAPGAPGGAPPAGGKGPGKDAPPAKDSAKGGGTGGAKDGAADGAKPAPRAQVLIARLRHVLKILHRPPDLRGGDLGVLRARRAGRDALAADRPISGDRAARGHRAGGLSRRVRRSSGANRCRAARKRDQRRAGHALHGTRTRRRRASRRSRSPSRSAPTSTTRRSTSTTA